ncbi:MAG: 23S rRNA (adenine(2503)-C(2))-methyltransferase RlmN [Oscillospiraceae bacterium]|jgi:23S rRNA (adenine2503-C2)-methyltransferase|nr:23S rRNA (adenine(2503)-C(2))-methyltransferase RlmN [Oscillospiraceae bacterium]
MPDLKQYTPEEIGLIFADAGLPRYRAEQVIRHLFGIGASSFDEMTDLPKELRAYLAEHFTLSAPDAVRKLESSDGTIKYLWKLRDGEVIESALLRYGYGNSLCVSTQAGCRMGCAFCASAPRGFKRNLSAAEILDQILFAQKESGLQISRVDLMGIGEPLDNFEAAARFIKLVNNPLFAPGGRKKGSPLGLNIGARHISVSTCAPPNAIVKFAELGTQCNLLVSLHAPDDETRNRLMPINRVVGVEYLFRDCADYVKRSGRRVSFEYAVIKGVNDTRAQAERLANLVLSIGAHVNLIRLNSANGDFVPGDVYAFRAMLTERKVNATVRRTLGADIDAACGQLRRSSTEIKDGGQYA